MKKRIFSLMLAFMMLLSVFPRTVRAAEDQPYRDVSIGDWYFQSVTFCTELGLMNGIGAEQFSPAGSINRAMFVTILHRLAGAPDAAPSGFSDVPAGSFYSSAVDWAAENGIVNGTSETTFSPAQSILRQDMACMLSRYLLLIDAEILRGDACEQAFCDIDLVSEYARDSVEVMRRTGLFRGDDASNFRPLTQPTGPKPLPSSPVWRWRWGSSRSRPCWKPMAGAIPFPRRTASGCIRYWSSFPGRRAFTQNMSPPTP